MSQLLRFRRRPLQLSSPEAQRLGLMLRGGRKTYPIDVEAVNDHDLATLAALAIVRARDRGFSEDVTSLVVGRAAVRPLEWDPPSAEAALAALGAVRQWSHAAMAVAVSAAAFLGPDGRALASSAAAHLLDLYRGSNLDVRHRGTLEERLTLSGIAGPGVDAGLLAAARAELAGSLAAIELEWISGQRFESRWLVATISGVEWDEPVERYRRDAAARSLSGIPSYVDTARLVLQALAARLDDIHARRVPFVPSKAVSPRDIEVVARAFKVASLADEPWFAEIVIEMLPRVVVAPNASKLVPSQSLAYRLADIIREYPTPESVASLAEAIHVVRHASVGKRLQRQIAGARRNLATGGRMARRAGGRSGRDMARDVTAFRAALEASFQRSPRPIDPWLRGLVADPTLGPLASSVIWSISQGAAQIGSGLWRDGAMVSLDGPVTAPAGARARPWHPIEATPGERAAWRLWIAREQISQPVRQAFREWYRPPDEELDLDATAMFAGIVASSGPLLAVAQKEGWRIESDYGRLWLESGDWAFSLGHDAGLYPGVDLRVVLREVVAWRCDSGEWRRARLRDVPAITLSEALRSADLIASVSAFASARDILAEGEPTPSERASAWDRLQAMPLTGQDTARRAALETILGSIPSAHRVSLADRFVEVFTRRGVYRIHYRTGLLVAPDGTVSAEGEPEPPVAIPMPWLPYDEALLELIVRRTVTLLQDG